MKFQAVDLPLIPECKNKSTDDSLLCAAWCLNLGIGEKIHRFELFGFYQSFIGKSSEQSLQGVIEKSMYWRNEKGTGYYSLNQNGKSTIEDLFKKNKYNLAKGKIYRLSRDFGQKTFTVELNGAGKKTSVFVNDRLTIGSIAADDLKALTKFNRATTGTSFIWNWIIDGNYYWEADPLNVSSNIAIKEDSKVDTTGNDYSMNYWIFQANPKVYDLESALKEIKKFTFTISRFKDIIKKGDFVFLWVSGDDAGLVATAKVMSNPDEIPQDPKEEKFSIDKDHFIGEKLRVKIEINDVLQNKISRNHIIQNSILSNLSIIRAPQGTNFALSSEESIELLKLISDQAKAPKETVVIDKPRIYTYNDLLADLGVEDRVVQGWLAALARKKQVIFYGPPGTGKTYAARKLAKYIACQNQGIIEIVQFHPSYAYEDFIQGIRPITREDGNLEYSLEKGRFLKFCDKARALNAKSVLIIDEINRAELSRVFGELMYLLEYRDEKVTLASGDSFSFPQNVYIIGTMNTADRSIALVDHALRRRFAFLRLFPDFDLLHKFHNNNGFNTEGLIEVLKRINLDIGDINYSVGVTFFLIPNIKNHIKSIWEMEIVPYLEEFFFDDQARVDNYRWDKVSEKILG